MKQLISLLFFLAIGSAADKCQQQKQEPKCGLQEEIKSSYNVTHRKWGKITASSNSEAKERLERIIFNRIYNDSYQGKCPEECPKLIHIITIDGCEITVNDKPVERINGLEWRYEIKCEWRSAVYCLAEGESLTPNGEMGEGCGKKDEQDGTEPYTYENGTSGKDACNSAINGAKTLIIGKVNALYKKVKCPDNCPEKIVVIDIGKSTTTEPEELIDEHGFRRWKCRATISWKAIIYCVPKGTKFKVEKQ